MPQVTINYPQTGGTFDQRMAADGMVNPTDASMSASLVDSNGTAYSGVLQAAAFPFNWAFKFSNVPPSGGPPNPNMYTLTVTGTSGGTQGSAQATRLTVP